MKHQRTNLAFHVPMYRYDGKHLIPVDYIDFRNSLIGFLKSKGIMRINSRMEKKQIEHYEFEEEILSIQCDATIKSLFIEGYIHLLTKYDDIFQHAFYIYGENGFNHCIIINDKDITIT
ncbi:MAG: hypothetical protein ACI4F4_09570 [Lachnospiraceae bacterium]